MEQTQVPHLFSDGIDWEYIPDGDPEWMYMLARHGFVLHLAQAYALSGEARFAQKAEALIDDFMRGAARTNTRAGSTSRARTASR